MKRLSALALALLAASTQTTVDNAAFAAAAPAAETPAPPAGSVAPPPGMPTFQHRAPAPAGDRLASGRSGAAIFSHACGACHLSYGMGTNLVTKQRVAMGEPPEKGLLANRNDLTAEYVEAIVRSGKGAMPPLTRVDITDAELKAVAAYLGKGK